MGVFSVRLVKHCYIHICNCVSLPIYFCIYKCDFSNWFLEYIFHKNCYFLLIDNSLLLLTTNICIGKGYFPKLGFWWILSSWFGIAPRTISWMKMTFILSNSLVRFFPLPLFQRVIESYICKFYHTELGFRDFYHNIGLVLFKTTRFQF